MNDDNEDEVALRAKRRRLKEWFTRALLMDIAVGVSYTVGKHLGLIYVSVLSIVVSIVVLALLVWVIRIEGRLHRKD